MPLSLGQESVSLRWSAVNAETSQSDASTIECLVPSGVLGAEWGAYTAFLPTEPRKEHCGRRGGKSVKANGQAGVLGNANVTRMAAALRNSLQLWLPTHDQVSTVSQHPSRPH